jgi:VWFA-related protein
MKKLLSAVLLLLLASGPVATQDTGDQAPQSANDITTTPERIAVRVDLVNVLFTATDKKNRLVLNLTKDDFRVFEDEKPQSVRFFSRESNLPLRIGILIDTSNSVRDRLRFEQESAVDFLNTALRPGKDLAYVLGFDVEAQITQDYTDDMEKLSTAIRSLQAGGGTGFYDAIYFACREKMLFFPPPEPYLRRVMIVTGDGLDNQSLHTREEALAMAQRAEVTIFAISTNRTGAARRGDKVLKRLAEETGGRAFFPFSVHDLAVNFREIARELRSQYSLAYVSTNPAHDGTFRRITIEALEKNARIRSKAGYFAPSQ